MPTRLSSFYFSLARANRLAEGAAQQGSLENTAAGIQCSGPVPCRFRLLCFCGPCHRHSPEDRLGQRTALLPESHVHTRTPRLKDEHNLFQRVTSNSRCIAWRTLLEGISTAIHTCDAASSTVGTTWDPSECRRTMRALGDRSFPVPAASLHNWRSR